MNQDPSTPPTLGAAAPGLHPSAQLVLARKLGARDAFVLLALFLLVSSLTALAIATGTPLVGALIIVAGLGITFYFGRSGATRQIPREGPLWKLEPERVAAGKETLKETIRHVGEKLRLPDGTVRANVLAPDDTGVLLHMVPELTLCMTDAELNLVIPQGFGCSGIAYQRRETTIAPDILTKGVVRAEDGRELVSRYYIGTQEEKLNPALAWVICTPIQAPNDSSVVGIVSIDGLANTPAEIPSLDDLKRVAHDVVDCSARLCNVLLGP